MNLLNKFNDNVVLKIKAFLILILQILISKIALIKHVNIVFAGTNGNLSSPLLILIFLGFLEFFSIRFLAKEKYTALSFITIVFSFIPIILILGGLAVGIDNEITRIFFQRHN